MCHATPDCFCRPNPFCKSQSNPSSNCDESPSSRERERNETEDQSNFAVIWKGSACFHSWRVCGGRAWQLRTDCLLSLTGKLAVDCARGPHMKWHSFVSKKSDVGLL